jgi:hypothetical protein
MKHTKISDKTIDGILASKEELIANGEYMEVDWVREARFDEMMTEQMFGDRARKSLEIKHARYGDLPHDNPSTLEMLGQY